MKERERGRKEGGRGRKGEEKSARGREERINVIQRVFLKKNKL
jgi:hypothetical protein